MRKYTKSADYSSRVTKSSAKAKCLHGRIIVDKCVEKNISLRELSVYLQFPSSNYLSHIISGKSHLNIDTARRMEKFFETDGLADRLMKMQADFELENWKKSQIGGNK